MLSISFRGNKLNQTHLKCERCGAILHIQCDAVDSLPEHLYEICFSDKSHENGILWEMLELYGLR